MDWLAQSMRFFPMSARSRFLTSQLICVGVVDIPLLISMMTVKFWAPASQLDDQNTRNVGRDFSRTSLQGVTRGTSPNVPVSSYRNYRFAACKAGSRSPASLASLAALSVASQVKSLSVRPKWPYAAVLR